MTTYRGDRVAEAGVRRHRPLLPVAAGIAGVVLAGLGATTVHGAVNAPGFGTPVASGIQANGFEQDVRLDTQNGYIYTSAPQSLSSSISTIWRSQDGGQTFKLIPAAVQPAGKPSPASVVVTASSPSTARAACSSTTSRWPTSVLRGPTTTATASAPTSVAPGFPMREWTASGTRSTAA